MQLAFIVHLEPHQVLGKQGNRTYTSHPHRLRLDGVLPAEEAV